MATTSAEQEIAQLEQEYWQALKDKDLDTLLRLTDFPCMVTGYQGHMLMDRESYVQMMEKPTWSLRSFKLNDVKVRMVRDDVAVIAYRAEGEHESEGKVTNVEAADASTWILRDGQWVCPLHTESLLQAPKS